MSIVEEHLGVISLVRLCLILYAPDHDLPHRRDQVHTDLLHSDSSCSPRFIKTLHDYGRIKILELHSGLTSLALLLFVNRV